jgi:uncharacterized protein YndB with AHSA1/START domain/uncharacterized damage-inducible protein DinB
MSEHGNIKLERTIKAPRERVWAALTEHGRIQEWLCDQALIEARAGGHYLFRWRSGFDAQGTLVCFEPPQTMAWIWIGTGEPGQTLVQWELAETPDGTVVTLTHVGFGSDPRGQATRAEAAKEWPGGLENLQSVLEEGLDLRQVRRPLMGVLLDGMSAERAAKEGIATTTGVYISGVVEGGAAEAAGLHKGDVMASFGKYELDDFSDLVTAMQAFSAGDTAEVGLVRGQERLVLPVVLRSRPIPPDPGPLSEAVSRLREAQSQVRAALAEVTAGLSDEQAAQPPAEGEWSVRDVLAHLSAAERDVHTNLLHLVVGFELVGEPDFAAAPDRNAVVLAMEPTLAGLLARFVDDLEETALLVERLSPATQTDRYRYRQALELVFNYVGHTNDHVEQIRRTVGAVKGN